MMTTPSIEPGGVPETSPSIGAASGAGPVWRREKKSRGWIWACLFLACAGAAAGGWRVLHGRATGSTSVVTFKVAAMDLDVALKLGGEFKALRNVEIRNEVEGLSTILTIVPEGKLVKEGDVLVELASDTIKDRVEDARIRVENAKAALVNSQQSVTIQEKQNESDLNLAETNAKLTQLEYDQFDKGDSLVEMATRKTALENAQTDLERKQEDFKNAKSLSAQGFVSSNDVLDAEIAERDARNKLETAKANLEVWNKYAEPRQRQTLERKRAEALRELERVKIKTEASLLLRQADVRAREATARVESSRLANLEKQLEHCTIKAPQPGMVVYQSSTSGSSYSSQGPIEEGAQVRMNQTLIQLPDTGRMLVEVRVAESLTDRIRPGLPCYVSVDALPGKVLTGKIEKISPMPDNSNRYFNPNLKEYPTQIVLDATPAGLKPGMSAKVEIQIAQLDNVIGVPLQAVFEGGGESYVYVGDGAAYEKRTVKVGVSSTETVQIVEGLKAGETVLLSRPKDAPEDAPARADKKSRPARMDAAGSGGAPKGSS
jgi:HlyD family secretion protein